jgi:ABC-type transport system involved in cytochrome c biogenesis ATPase subunit
METPMRVDVAVEGNISRTIRARQLEAAFDVPATERHKLAWAFDAPLDEQPWSVGLIVGPSGSGKSTILRSAFGEMKPMEWHGDGVVDDFPDVGIDAIQRSCEAVGFNTIPAYLRPFAVLSNGEQFRVEMARRMLESDADSLIVLDEFTSVVDRQVAKIAAHAVQKWVRRNDRKLVAASCHYDVIDWLQPDWIIEPATGTFTWRSLQRRPPVPVCITPVGYEAWSLFAPFHYLTGELNHAAKCYVLFAGEHEEPAAFAGILHRPHYRVAGLWGVSRLVTLPDWQGLGLAFVLADLLGSAFKADGRRLRTYPAHPALIRNFDRSPVWSLIQKPEMRSTAYGPKAQLRDTGWRPGGRPNAVFEYVGPAMSDRMGAGMLVRHV